MPNLFLYVVLYLHGILFLVSFTNNQQSLTSVTFLVTYQLGYIFEIVNSKGNACNVDNQNANLFGLKLND
jgi:hypothetical protein